MVKPGQSITVTVEKIVNISCQISADGKVEEWVFAWSTCQGGDRLWRWMDNPAYLYVAPRGADHDCVRVSVEKGGVLLTKSSIWVDVRE